MFLTHDILVKHGACGKGLKWFDRYFPDGGELMDVIQHKYVSPHILQWGYTNLPSTADEKKAFIEKLNINCANPSTVYESYNISNSSFVSDSHDIENSDYIYDSFDIDGSKWVCDSDNVSNSIDVSGSSFVYDGYRVVNCKNVTNSHNIVNSDYIIESFDVINASGVTKSAFINSLTPERTRRISNCYFVNEGNDLDHCLFCSQISDKSYHLFNQPITETQYTVIMNQMFSILRDYKMNLIDRLEDYHRLPIQHLRAEQDPAARMENLPEKFWRWVRTLPGYSPRILYQITFNIDLLREW